MNVKILYLVDIHIYEENFHDFEVGDVFANSERNKNIEGVERTFRFEKVRFIKDGAFAVFREIASHSSSGYGT